MAFSPLMPQELFTRELLKNSEKRGHRRNNSADAVLTPSASLRRDTAEDEGHAEDAADGVADAVTSSAKKERRRSFATPQRGVVQSGKTESKALAFLKSPIRGLKLLGRDSPRR